MIKALNFKKNNRLPSNHNGGILCVHIDKLFNKDMSHGAMASAKKKKNLCFVFWSLNSLDFRFEIAPVWTFPPPSSP
jgi:hypothetical protein